MLRLFVKDIHPEELKKALHEIYKNGFYNADAANINYRRLLQHQEKQKELQLTDKENEFLKLACNDITYKQVAATCMLSERTVDGYRENIFKKIKRSKPYGHGIRSYKKKYCNALNNSAAY